MVRRVSTSAIGHALLALCLVLLVQVSEAIAGNVRLYWDPNSEPDLAGYVLVYGTASGVYTSSITLPSTAVTHEVTNLPNGTYYFAVRAFNGANAQSAYSNEVRVVVISTPVISAVSPASGPAEGGTAVTIGGADFRAGLGVFFGGVEGLVTGQTATSITALTPARSAGTVSITVTNADGGSATSSAFTFLPSDAPESQPTITSLTPASGPTVGGTAVTIDGSDFDAGATVLVGGVPATVTGGTDTSLTVVMPPGVAGAAAVSVTNPDGGVATRPSAFTYLDVSGPISDPVITSLTPLSGPTTGGTLVIISGEDFRSGASVLFGTQAGVVTSQSPTSLVVLTPAAAAGAVSVTVANADGGSVSLAAAFTFVTPAPSNPTITSVTPITGPTTGNTTVTIAGTGFSTGVSVRFGGVAGTITSQTATSIAVLTPVAIAGTVPVTVLNTDGGSVTRASAFTYTATTTPSTAPTLTTFAPALGTTLGGTDVTITGTNFRSGVIVRFGTVSATVTSVTSTRVIARTPAHAAGVVTLTVLNTDGSGVQLPQVFTYRAPAPRISSHTPARGPASGSTDMTINGSNFQPGASVSVDNLPATIISVTASRIVARLPAHAPAIVGVTVTNPDAQSAAKVNAYTYVSGGPAIRQVLPAAGPMSGGGTITILGSGFLNSSVSFGGVGASVVSRAAEMITVRVPARGAGVVDVTVRNGDGLAMTASGAYLYLDPNAPFVRYFAEGAAGSFFQTRFALANPHAEDMPVTVTFTDTQGTPTTMELTLAAKSRTTIDETNRPVLASEAFATRFEAPKVIAVERTMSWAAGGPVYGSHSDTGVMAPRTSWLFAEGATIGGFNTFYLMQNSTTTAAEVKVQYLLSTGEIIERVHPVAPLSRTNIWVNKDAPALQSAEMSATITSLNNVPVVVERSMYRNNGNELFSAGHNSVAVDAPALRWFLAEGATGGTFDEFVLVANPNAAAANLKVSYLRAGKAPIVKNYTAAARSRLTIWVDQEAPELAAAEVSIIVESLTPTPVVVERSMWWRATPAGEWVESHNNRGVTTTAARWLVADGDSGGAGDTSTYVLVANTGTSAVKVNFTLLSESGAVRTVQDTVTANGRYSMDVAGTFPEARGTRFSVLVEGVTATAPLVVERASYSSTPTTAWAAGTNSLGMPLP